MRERERERSTPAWQRQRQRATSTAYNKAKRQRDGRPGCQWKRKDMIFLASHHNGTTDTKALQSIRCQVSDEILSTFPSYTTQRQPRVGLKNFSKPSQDHLFHQVSSIMGSEKFSLLKIIIDFSDISQFWLLCSFAVILKEKFNF